MCLWYRREVVRDGQVVGAYWFQTVHQVPEPGGPDCPVCGNTRRIGEDGQRCPVCAPEQVNREG